MPTYEVEIDGRVHEIESDKDLSPAAVQDYSRILRSSAADRIPTDPNLKAPPAVEESPSFKERFSKEAGAVLPAAGYALQRTSSALGQLATEPFGNTSFRDQARWTQGKLDALHKEAPIGSALGEGGEMAAEAMLPAGQAVKGAGALERVGSAAAMGGVYSMAGSPALGDKKDFAKEKTEQFGLGAAFGGAAAAGYEGASRLWNEAKRHVFGVPSQQQQDLLPKAKDMGFDVSPSQIKQDDTRRMQAGTYQNQSLKNQKVTNTKASTPTGVTADALTPDFFNERFTTLGKEYGEIYKPGTKLKVDAAAVQALKDLVAQEEKMGHPWMVGEAKKAAERIAAEFDIAQATAGKAKVQALKINADDLQRLVTGLKDSAHAKSGEIEGRILSDVINDINESVARNHPDLKAKLDVLNPKYRTLATLDDARKRGIIDAQGNLSAADLGSLLNRTDPRYRSGKSTHPLQDLGRVGETFGIRGIGQGRTTGGQGLAAGAIGDAAPVTKAGAYRYVMQQGVDNPVGQWIHKDYVRNPQGTVSKTRPIKAAQLAGELARPIYRLGDRNEDTNN